MKNNQDLLKRLKSDDLLIVEKAIAEIKDTGDMSIVANLLDLLIECKDLAIRSRLTALLSDIKDQSFKKLLMDKIVAMGQMEERSYLLRVCWESSIDFSQYIELFITLLTDSDFSVALEASTIIGNLSEKMSDDTINQAIEHIQKIKVSEDRLFLIEDTIEHLNHLIESES